MTYYTVLMTLPRLQAKIVATLHPPISNAASGARIVSVLRNTRRSHLVAFSSVRLDIIRAAFVSSTWTATAPRSPTLATRIWTTDFDFCLRICRRAYAQCLDHARRREAPAEAIPGKDSVSATIIGAEREIFTVSPSAETTAERAAVHFALNWSSAYGDRIVGRYSGKDDGCKEEQGEENAQLHYGWS